MEIKTERVVTYVTYELISVFCFSFCLHYNMSQCMRYSTMWYVRPAKAQTSLRIRAV